MSSSKQASCIHTSLCCQAIVLFHIRSGNYGNTKLDGLDFIIVESWPKAIHEGNGTALLLITNKANEEQRKALIQIVSGQAKGDSPFPLFVGTFSRFLDPQFVDINAKIDGGKSSFSVPGIVNVEFESFTNPVTGEEQDTKVQLPKGIVWKLVDAAKSKIMQITHPQMNFDHSGKNAFYSVIEYRGP